MKCLFLDANRFKAEKPQKKETEELSNCLVVFITFEAGDSENQVKGMCKEAVRISKEFNKRDLLLAPFAHLSSNLLAEKDAKELLDICKNKLAGRFKLLLSEFGVEKGLMLDIKPGKNNVKFREF